MGAELRPKWPYMSEIFSNGHIKQYSINQSLLLDVVFEWLQLLLPDAFVWVTATLQEQVRLVKHDAMPIHIHPTCFIQQRPPPPHIHTYRKQDHHRTILVKVFLATDLVKLPRTSRLMHFDKCHTKNKNINDYRKIIWRNEENALNHRSPLLFPNKKCYITFLILNIVKNTSNFVGKKSVNLLALVCITNGKRPWNWNHSSIFEFELQPV